MMIFWKRSSATTGVFFSLLFHSRKTLTTQRIFFKTPGYVTEDEVSYDIAYDGGPNTETIEFVVAGCNNNGEIQRFDIKVK